MPQEMTIEVELYPMLRENALRESTVIEEVCYKQTKKWLHQSSKKHRDFNLCRNVKSADYRQTETDSKHKDIVWVSQPITALLRVTSSELHTRIDHKKKNHDW